MLVVKLRPYIEKKTTRLRKPIPVEEKLAVTLRFLATGESYSSLSFLFRISPTTISRFVPIVCHYIYQVLKEEHCSIPKTEQDWIKLSDDSYDRWQFPNSLLAIDGKHIALENPEDGGSEFHNYKSFFSIVFLALVSYDYRFVAYDVGCQGRISDGGVWVNSTFYHKLKNGGLNLPPPRMLPRTSDPAWMPLEDDTEVPFVIVGDSAFPLTENIMKPYPDKSSKSDDSKKLFNYRLSRFRRVSENAFGIWSSRFRIFRTTINLEPDTVCLIANASIALHNMMCVSSRETYAPRSFVDRVGPDGNIIDGDWRDEEQSTAMRDLRPRTAANKPKKSAVEIRDIFKNYFMGPGAVEWQWAKLL